MARYTISPYCTRLVRHVGEDAEAVDDVDVARQPPAAAEAVAAANEPDAAAAAGGAPDDMEEGEMPGEQPDAAAAGVAGPGGASPDVSYVLVGDDDEPQARACCR